MPKWVPRKSDWCITAFASFFIIFFCCILQLDRLCSTPYLFLIVATSVFLFFSVPIAFSLRLLRRIKQGSPEKTSIKIISYNVLAALVTFFIICYVGRTLLASTNNGSLKLLLVIVFQAAALALIGWRYAHLRKRLPKN